jgi:hypothetical protein
MANPKWSQRAGWAAIAIAAVSTLVLFYLVVSTALDTGKGMWAAFLVFTFGVIATVTALVAAGKPPLDGRRRHPWLQPRPVSLIFVVIFTGFGTMTNALALLAPRPAIESEPGAIEKGVNDIRSAVVPKQEELPRIRLKLPGIWGETGCAVTYRFALQDRALTVDSVRRPPGSQPHHLVATITSVDRDVMHVTGEQPQSARGKAATFTYVTNGITERVTWDDQVSAVPLELDRCG